MRTQTHTAMGLIAAERERQIAEEGFSKWHDDEHSRGELADAAACYALDRTKRQFVDGVPGFWPWHREWWKPRDRKRDLIRAGALIVAELERLERITPSETEFQQKGE